MTTTAYILFFLLLIFSSVILYGMFMHMELTLINVVLTVILIGVACYASYYMIIPFALIPINYIIDRFMTNYTEKK